MGKTCETEPESPQVPLLVQMVLYTVHFCRDAPVSVMVSCRKLDVSAGDLMFDRIRYCIRCSTIPVLRIRIQQKIKGKN